MRAHVRTLFAAGLCLLAATPCAVAVSGCGGDESSSTGGDRRPLVTFGRSGGTDGRVYGLVVERGGGATLTQYPQGEKRFTVDTDKRDGLREGLEGLDFKSLQPTYLPSTTTPNGFRYSVTYDGRTVEAAEHAQIPDKLKSVIDLLNELVDGEV
jgi:hypothetical protein